MFFRLALLFTLLPLAELALLIKVGRATSVGTALGIVIATGVIGAAVARYEGLRTLVAIRREAAAGRLPGDQLIDALLILVAGLLLVTPGLITDTVGLLLLVPPARRFARERLKKRFRTRFTMMHFGSIGPSCPPSDDDFVDVHARPADQKKIDGQA